MTNQFVSSFFRGKMLFCQCTKTGAGVQRLGILGVLGKWHHFEDMSIKQKIYLHIKGK